ncbi:MAG: hypothetical protein HZA53_08110 [Planctomycetes bacterium]|nr:hypothetical protein [Planctomycetota bacterium]
MKLSVGTLVRGLAALIVTTSAHAQGHRASITVFLAKKIVTMDPTRPTATAVAVRDGQILGVGSLQDLGPWLRDNAHTIDERFSEKVLMPGFIDPHMHPMLAAIQFGTTWITPEPWDVMGVKIQATTGHEAYMGALRAAFAAAPKTVARSSQVSFRVRRRGSRSVSTQESRPTTSSGVIRSGTRLPILGTKLWRKRWYRRS